MHILDKQQKMEQKFSNLEVIGFELIALNTRFYWERIIFISCQYVSKQSEDFRYY